MENVLNFEPLWHSKELFDPPYDAIKQIRGRVLKLFLLRNTEIPHHQPNVEGKCEIVKESQLYLSLLFVLPDSQYNPILKRLFSEAVRTQRHDPVDYIQAMLNEWYASASSFLTRDPEQGMPPENEDDGPGDSGEVSTWDSDYSAAQHLTGNLGVLSMIVTGENWEPPKHSTLQMAALVSNSATSIIYAAFVISVHLRDDSWRTLSRVLPSRVSSIKFVQTAWQVARQAQPGQDTQPGSQFGALPKEFKVMTNGRGILTHIGDEQWRQLGYWHPAKESPGSAWNKFFKNTRQPLFRFTKPESVLQAPHPSDDPNFPFPLVHRFPSSAINLAEPWENHYAQLRHNMDQTGRERGQISGVALARQFADLSKHTSLDYAAPNNGQASGVPSINPTSFYLVQQDYLYVVPMVKRPISDQNGHATLPFLTSVANAFRFNAEPMEVQQELEVDTFGGWEIGDLTS